MLVFRGTQVPAQSGLHGRLLWDELSLALSDPQGQLSVSPLLLQHGLLARLLLPLRLQLPLHLLLTNTPAETLVTEQVCGSIKVALLKAWSHQHKCRWHLQNMLSYIYSDSQWLCLSINTKPLLDSSSTIGCCSKGMFKYFHKSYEIGDIRVLTDFPFQISKPLSRFSDHI